MVAEALLSQAGFLFFPSSDTGAAALQKSQQADRAADQANLSKFENTHWCRRSACLREVQAGSKPSNLEYKTLCILLSIP